MHNINYIRENPIEFDNAMKQRGELPISSKILEIDKIKRETQTVLQNILSERNLLSKEIGKLKSEKKDVSHIVEKVEKFKDQISNLKELKLRPGTEVHDYNFKIKNAKKFLTKGDKVKFTVKFKGREMQHIQLGKDLMERIITDTKEIGQVEVRPKFEGRQMIMIIQPN